VAEHPNVQRLRDAYAAFSKGDIDRVTQEWSSDIVWHVGGNSPLAGDYKGQEEIVGFFGKILELGGGSFAIEVHDVLANDDHAVVLVHETGKRDGKTLDTDSAHVFHLKDGKTTEFWAMPTDQASEDAFWS
jgi:ketosteroid isomerase-like protein